MNEIVVSSGLRYAVIAGLRTETGSERLVIAYRNEESLRDLIAAPSIIAVGFSSRREAVTGSRACARTSQGTQEATPGRKIDEDEHLIDCVEQTGIVGFTLRRLARCLVTSYRDVATAAVVMFSSSNALSAVIRMALGSSV